MYDPFTQVSCSYMRYPSLALCLGLSLAVACSGDHVTTPPTSCGTGVGAPISLAVGAYASIDPAASSGCFQFAANTSPSESTEYLVVAQSATGTAGQSSPFNIRGGAAATAAAAIMARTVPPDTRTQTAVQFDRTMRRMGRTRSYPSVQPASHAAPRAATVAGAPAPPAVGSLRVFKVCGNLACSTIKSVAAKARVVGAHIAVYVDTLAPAGGLDSADLDTLKQVFDSRLYPIDTAAFGGVSDIDSNSVVIVLMTGIVNALVSKTRCQTSGYVAGFFFPGDLDPTTASQFNHGEVFYSIVADPNGTLSCAHSDSLVKAGTPVTFVHEFQHMISFVQHVLVRGGSSEEGWLDEGLSKYAEELAGRSFLPGDPQSFSNFAFGDVYDAYQYLLAPSGSPLLIPEDTGTLAEIGASWLFTRYMIDQFGAGVALKLHQTTLVGSANVAAQTGQPFTTLVTRWALANWVSDLPSFSAPSELQYSSWHFRTTFGSLNSQDSTNFPRAYALLPATGAGGTINVSGTLTSGSGAYARVFQPPNGAGFSLHFTRDGSTALAAALVPRLDVIRIR
ncbi:MAG TPA: hypothetical protein VFP39_18005 [Gemmatimonadales bacterium]|nr:hypothetical protein [Gemmatimonadales bacterium]